MRSTPPAAAGRTPLRPRSPTGMLALMEYSFSLLVILYFLHGERFSSNNTTVDPTKPRSNRLIAASGCVITTVGPCTQRESVRFR